MSDQSVKTDPPSKKVNPIDKVLHEVRKVIQGHEQATEKLAYAMFAGGHALLESVPGLAKTLMFRAFNATIEGAKFSRVQMTPDLLPADITGGRILDLVTSQFKIDQGPIFSNVFLADEINRTSPKTQSALLEAMAEKSVTLGGQTFKLPKFFMLGATMNPLEQEGTYPLPEAQLDRFMFKIWMTYVSKDQEKAMLRDLNLQSEDPLQAIEKVISAEDIVKWRECVRKQMYFHDYALDYIVDLVRASRKADPADPNQTIDPMFNHVVKVTGEEGQRFAESVAFGGSPRAEQALKAAAAVRAFHKGRNFVLPDDVKYIFPDVMRHRILLQRKAKLQKYNTEMAIQTLLKGVPFHSKRDDYRPPKAKA